MGKKFRTLREAKHYLAQKSVTGMRLGIYKIGKAGNVYRYWVGTQIQWLNR